MRIVEARANLQTVQKVGGWASLRQLTRYRQPQNRRNGGRSRL